MVVLKIIGLLLVALFIYWVVLQINKYTYRKHRYDFFNMHNFVVTTIGYGFLFFGNQWYVSALNPTSSFPKKKSTETSNFTILFNTKPLIIGI